MPDFPNDENGDVLRGLVRDGDDLTKPRDVDFSVIFMDKASAERFMEIVKHQDVKVELNQQDQDDQTWGVTVTRFMIPTHHVITSMEINLEEIAKPLGGKNDGWGCFAITN